MPRGRDTKVWNEDLVEACKNRFEQAVRNGDRRQFMWRDGAQKLEAVQKDIYTFSTGRVVNMPTGLKKTVHELCMDVIHGRKDKVPDGYVQAVQQGTQPQGNPFENHPYLKTIQARSGAYAILLAFRCSASNTLSKSEICRLAQPYCDSAMEPNFHAGRLHGAWSSNKTLVNHGLIVQSGGGARYVDGVGFRGTTSSFTLTRDGEQFIECMLRKFPQARGGAAAAMAHPAATTNPGHTFSTKKSPFRTPSHARSTSAKSSRTKELAQGDGEKLLNWIVTGAQVGDTMDFKVGKARRKQLHDACDDLERELLGLKLNHHSEFESGTSNRRVLTVRIMQLPTEMQVTSSTKRRLFDGSHASVDTGSTASTMAAKRPRTDLPPSVAAAEAALKRQAEYESRVKKEQEAQAYDAEMKRVLEESARMASETTPAFEGNEMDQKHAAATSADGFDDEELSEAIRLSQESAAKAPPHLPPEELDRKPAAKTNDGLDDEQVKQVTKLSEQTSIELQDFEDEEELVRRAIEESASMAKQSAALPASELYSSDSDDDLLNAPPTFGANNRAKTKKVQNPNVKRSLFRHPPDNETIDLLSDDDKSPASLRKDSRVPGLIASRPASASLPESGGCRRPAKRPPLAPPQQEVIDIDSESEQDDEDVIEILDDSQDMLAPFTADAELGLRHSQLTILIDNRERNRNLSPRYLRMELTRIVSNGDLKSVWPRQMPAGNVEEQSLILGDFAFDIECNSAGRKRIPVVVERKRVPDLVQRSVSGDHWKQFLRMRDNCAKAIFLVESDTRTASRFTAFGAQELEGWDPNSTVIEDERSIFLFFARALLSSQTANFIQTRDEIASLRAVAAVGLMAVASEEFRSKAAKAAPMVRNCDTRLVDRLTAGGLPWKLARLMGDLLGSVHYLEKLYRECSSEVCRSCLLAPFITETEFNGQVDTAIGWSHKIFQVVRTSLDSSGAVSECGTTLGKRRVTIELPEDKSNLFQAPAEESFYRLKLRTKNPLGLALPTIVMQTTVGRLSSHRLFVHLLQAKEMVPLITTRIRNAKCGGDFVAVAKEVANVVNGQSCHQTMAKGKDRRVLLLIGLSPAIDAAAKKAGYMSETRVLVDMVLADLMLSHDLVVIQAVRLKGDTELILQLLTLACFHYHLLFQERR